MEDDLTLTFPETVTQLYFKSYTGKKASISVAELKKAVNGTAKTLNFK